MARHYCWATLIAVGSLSIATARDARAVAAADSARASDIHWTAGPASGRLSGQAELDIPASCAFTGQEGAAIFMELTENPPSGRESGILLCADPHNPDATWFVVFRFDPSGYVRDDGKDSLDADAILASVRRGTEESNRERRAHGWSEMRISGWSIPPFYDSVTHNLTWAIRGESGDSQVTVNHSVRLLGREGVMHADLVAGPAEMTQARPVFEQMLASYKFIPGHKYSEWRAGDKVAAYGLTALIAGGVGAAAMKSGILVKLWKVIVAGVVGVLAWLRAIVARIRRNPASPNA